MIFAHLNINSIRNKFEELISQVKGTVDVLMISETKIDDSFPIANFLMDGFSQPYRIDRNSSGGGIMLYVREDIPSNLLKVEPLPIEGFYVELKLRSENWLINCSYNPNRNAISNHIGALSDFLDFHSSTYNNIIILGDFNVGGEEPHMKTFCENYNLQNLIKQPTCYKNPSRPTSIDLILTNVPRSFQSTCVIETGLSDFHLMTLTVMKKSFKKFQPRIINYRSYKHFSNDTFRKDLIDKLSNEELVINDDGMKRFCELNINILNKHAPRKIKYARGNQIPFFTKQLSKEIMTRSRLRNKYLRNKNEDNRALYVKQRNYCVSLLRKSKKKYYENLDERNLIDNKLFWKTIKPSFSDKIITRDRIHLTENGEVVKTELETAETLNNFFGNVTKSLMIPKYNEYDPSTDRVKNRTIRAILKYRNHPSILAIREQKKAQTYFCFKEVSIEETQKEVLNLNNKKASQNSDIPTKIIKENSDIFGKALCSFINDSIKSFTFPSCLKEADITPIHKKGKKDKKENYRPVSILPVLSKMFERIMFKQMSAFFEDIFNKQQCGFRKGYNTQQCLLKMLEKWKRSVDGGNAFGALLTDLSKAFDCLDHELLIAKLHAYGFSLPALRLINDYLSNRKQRTRIGNSFSDWCEIILGVPQGSILGPLLFNIFLADLFLVLKDVDIANFADDNTPYTSANNIDELIDSLEKASGNLFKWFKDNLFKGNPDKCHLLVSTNEKNKNKYRRFFNRK